MSQTNVFDIELQQDYLGDQLSPVSHSMLSQGNAIQPITHNILSQVTICKLSGEVWKGYDVKCSRIHDVCDQTFSLRHHLVKQTCYYNAPTSNM